MLNTAGDSNVIQSIYSIKVFPYWASTRLDINRVRCTNGGAFETLDANLKKKWIKILHTILMLFVFADDVRSRGDYRLRQTTFQKRRMK